MGYNEFERYDMVKGIIEENGGTICEDQAIELLAEIGIMYEDTDKLQWTVLYNLTTGDGRIFAHRNNRYDAIQFDFFHLLTPNSMISPSIGIKTLSL